MEAWSTCTHCNCGFDWRPIQRIDARIVAACAIDAGADTELEEDDLRSFLIDAARARRTAGRRERAGGRSRRDRAEALAARPPRLRPRGGPRAREGRDRPSGDDAADPRQRARRARDAARACAHGRRTAPLRRSGDRSRRDPAGPAAGSARDRRPRSECARARVRRGHGSSSTPVIGTSFSTAATWRCRRRASICSSFWPSAPGRAAPAVEVRAIEERLWGAGVHRIASTVRQPIRALRTALGETAADMIAYRRNPNGYSLMLALASSEIAVIA